MESITAISDQLPFLVAQSQSGLRNQRDYLRDVMMRNLQEHEWPPLTGNVIAVEQAYLNGNQVIIHNYIPRILFRYGWRVGWYFRYS